MRIGILTYHFAYNFGAMMQAYALRKTVKRLVREEDIVEIINYRPASFLNIGESSGSTEFVRQSINREDFLKTECGVKGAPVTNIHEAPEFDIYIVGSDQVWNPNLPVREETSEYFLDFVAEGKIRIAYAASIGEEISKSFNENLFKINIPKFDYLSVREQSYVEFIQKFTDKKCYEVFDPSLLLTSEDYEYLIPVRECADKHILFVTYNSKKTRRVSDFVNRYAIRHNLKILHMNQEITPYAFLNEDETLFYSEMGEILWAIKNADIVIADSFHFIVFSIIFHKPFYAKLAGRNSRITDLLRYLQLEDRILSGNEKLEDISYDIDYDKVDKLIEKKKKLSLEFLEEALMGKGN